MCVCVCMIACIRVCACMCVCESEIEKPNHRPYLYRVGSLEPSHLSFLFATK